MKPYQFYSIRHFPDLVAGQTVKTMVQMTFSGEGEDVDTSFTLENQQFEGSLAKLRVQSQVKHEIYGYIKKVIGNQRTKLEFSEYLQPVDFPAFIDTQRGVVIFQAPKKVCRGVLSNLRSNNCGVNLVEMTVDFSKVLLECPEYLGAWFRGVSSKIRAAGVSGTQIQEDALFRKLLKDGKLSNVTIPWLFEDNEHHIMLTGGSAVVLVQDYRTNQGLELQLAIDVYDKLLSKVWEEKKTRNNSDDGLNAP